MNTKLQIILLIHFLLRFVAKVAVLIGVVFAEKSLRQTTHYGQDLDIQRYVLPNWLSWFNTPDEDGWPMYEPTVAKIYNKFGWRVVMYYNLGLRNVAQGWLWKFGKEVNEEYYLIQKKGTVSLEELVYAIPYMIRNDLNTKTWNLGLFKVVFGWEVCHDHYLSHTRTGYYAIPNISFEK